MSIHTTPLESEKIEVSAYGPFAPLSLQSDQAAIDDFVVSSIVPEPGQDYTVTANYSCTDIAELSANRDGEEVAKSWGYLPVETKQGTVSMATPGEPLGYLDHIKAWATNFDPEKTVTRERVIVNGAPKISVRATDSLADENGGNATFTFTREGAGIAKPLSVWFTWGGSGDPLDFKAVGEEGFTTTLYATFAANASSTTVDIFPIDDDKIEGTETVTVTLRTSMEGEYKVGSPNGATVLINDNDGGDPGDCLDYWIHYVTSEPDYSFSFSGDPDYPTINWSLSNGGKASELYIESPCCSCPVYHLVAADGGSIPNSVRWGEYGYQGTSAGEYCGIASSSCEDYIYPFREEHCYGHGSYDVCLEVESDGFRRCATFYISGLKDECD